MRDNDTTKQRREEGYTRRRINIKGGSLWEWTGHSLTPLPYNSITGRFTGVTLYRAGATEDTPGLWVLSLLNREKHVIYLVTFPYFSNALTSAVAGLYSSDELTFYASVEIAAEGRERTTGEVGVYVNGRKADTTDFYRTMPPTEFLQIGTSIRKTDSTARMNYLTRKINELNDRVRAKRIREPHEIDLNHMTYIRK